eukprot:9215110-Pyramimonas_sp.AAC.1
MDGPVCTGVSLGTTTATGSAIFGCLGIRTRGRKAGPAIFTAGTWAKHSDRPLDRFTRFTSRLSARHSASSSTEGRSGELSQHMRQLAAL